MSAQPTPVAEEIGWKLFREWLTVIGGLLGGLGFLVAVWALFVSQDALEGSTMATIYSLGQDSTKFFIENPEAREYFYKDGRGDISDDDLLKKFDNLDPKVRAKYLMGSELLLDFMQITFEQQKNLPRNDWNSWWHYFCDAYDESPVLRRNLDMRPTWYSVKEPLENKGNRESHLRGRPLWPWFIGGGAAITLVITAVVALRRPRRDAVPGGTPAPTAMPADTGERVR